MISGSSGARFSTKVMRRASARRSPASTRSTRLPGASPATAQPIESRPACVKPRGASLDRPGDTRKIGPMAWRLENSFLYQAARSGFVVAGTLLLAVGAGDMVAGRSKIQEYRSVVREVLPPEPHDPTALFPKASEAQERHALAQAKLAFYQVLFLGGQFLATGGVVLLAIGAYLLRQRTLRVAPPAGSVPSAFH